MKKIDKMKKFLILTFLAFTNTVSGQILDEVKLKNGKEIIIYENKSWDYKQIDQIQNTTSNNDKIYASIEEYSEVYLMPSQESRVDKNFNKNNFEIMGIVNLLFKIKDSNGRIGYCKSWSIDNSRSYMPKLREKYVAKGKKSIDKLLIKGIGVTEINSANGVDFSIDWGYFNEQKDIKYITFHVMPYNNVGDIQKCSISGHSEFKAQITGPISAKSEFNNPVWGTAWYNNSVKCLVITKVKVQYMDGSQYTYVKELNKIIDKNYMNTCK